MNDDLLDAVDKIADTSFDAAKTFGANLIAERPSGSKVTGFYRPGERPADGAPFEVLPTKCLYSGPPTPAAPAKKAWQLEEEYRANRLGKTPDENSRLWDTALWIEKHNQITHWPVEAISAFNLVTGNLKDAADAQDLQVIFGSRDEGIKASFGIQKIEVHPEAMKLLNGNASADDVIKLMNEIHDEEKLAEIVLDKALNKHGDPRLGIDQPTCDERIESGKIIRALQQGMHSLWFPVKRAIFDLVSMTDIGKSEHVGKEYAASVGRQRVRDGLRIAGAIRKEFGKRDNHFQAIIEPRKPAPVVYHASLSRWERGSYLNQVPGPVMKVPANDNYGDYTMAA